MSYETVKLDIHGQVAYVRLNRPSSLNALNSVMIEELVQCLKSVSGDEEVKMVVISGNGGSFSAGGDIKEMLELEGEEAFFSVIDKINTLTMTLYSMPQLTLAAIEGAVAGLGLSIALATDYIVCKKNSRLAMNFIGIGLVPDGGGHFLLEQRLGVVKAKQLIWEGKVLGATEALAIGLIEEVTEQLEAAVEHCIDQWSRKPILAMIKSKKILAELNRGKLLLTLELEKQAQWAMRNTDDHQEGIKAFTEKRKPLFLGK